ncbi:MAG: PAS domain-containing protein, partial [Desulfobacterales bacterium]|nr:PAS domain-containing protein [Desulfobacterales bacterium]
MKDNEKSKNQLMKELETLKKRISQLAEKEVELKKTEKEIQSTCTKLKIEVNDRTNELLKINEELNVEINERIEAENILKENQARLVKAQRIARMSFWNWNLKTDEIILSDEIYRIYNLKHKEVSTMPELIRKIVYPDDTAYVRKNLDLARQGIQEYDVDHRAVHPPSGNIIWVHGQAELTRDKEGNPKSMLGTIVNIAERKKTENNMRKSEIKYKALVENANDAIFVLQDGFINFCNHKSEEMSGYGQEELKKLFFLDFIHPEDRDM